MSMNSYSEKTGRMIALLLIAGSGVVAVAKGMSLSFLAIRLQQDFGLGPAGIGALIGVGPLLGAMVSPLARAISDRLGRRTVLAIAISFAGLGMAGLGLAQSVAAFTFAHIVASIAGAVYEPAARAMMSDAAPERLRLKVFSWRYLAINAGWAIGPMIGLAFGATSDILFVVAGMVHLMFGIIIFLLVPEIATSAANTAQQHIGGWRRLVGAFRDPRLMFFAGGGTLLVAVYGQWSVPLSQYIIKDFTRGVEIFALLVSTNAAAVLVASTPARWVIERIGALHALVLGCVLFLLGNLGFAASSGVEMLVASMIVFTIGEVLVVPAEYMLVDGISTAANRGTYFGAHSLSTIGNFFGPLLAGMALGAYGGTGMFLLFAVFSAGSALLFAIGHSLPPPRRLGADAPAEAVDTALSDLLRAGRLAPLRTA